MLWQTASPNHINYLKPLKPLLYITTQDGEGNTAKELQANWKIIHLRCREDRAPFLWTFIETRSRRAACTEPPANRQSPRDVTCSFFPCLAGFTLNNSWEMQGEKKIQLYRGGQVSKLLPPESWLLPFQRNTAASKVGSQSAPKSWCF